MLWSDEIVWVGSQSRVRESRTSCKGIWQGKAPELGCGWDKPVDAVLTSCQIRGISVPTVSTVEALVCVGRQKTLKIKALKCREL